MGPTFFERSRNIFRFKFDERGEVSGGSVVGSTRRLCRTQNSSLIFCKWPTHINDNPCPSLEANITATSVHFCFRLPFDSPSSIMPGLGATDPADLEAHARAQLGLTRQLQVTRRIAPHPSKGGAPGYPAWYRVEQLAKRANGEPFEVSEQSLDRWEIRLFQYRMTGNKPREQLVSADMMNLVLFLLAYPDATQQEMAVFIYNEGGELYTVQTISQRLKDLDITKKQAATDAYQSMKEDVQYRLDCFFNFLPPLGIRDVPRYKLIDIDEFGMTLEKLNCKGGWAMKIFRVRKDGHYHHGAKVTCLLGIEPGDPRVPTNQRGSIENPRRWVTCIRQIGTTAIVFCDFCDKICTDIENNPLPNTDDHRILMWDNLISHHSAYVHQTVTGRPGPPRFSSWRVRSITQR